VVLLFALAKESGEDPAERSCQFLLPLFSRGSEESLQISTSSVKVQVQLLTSNSHGNQVFGIL
jgi:hypothetical protein